MIGKEEGEGLEEEEIDGEIEGKRRGDKIRMGNNINKYPELPTSIE